jgi:hypothetical protein
MALAGNIDPRNEKTTMKRCKKDDYYLETIGNSPGTVWTPNYVAFVVMDHCSVSCY